MRLKVKMELKIQPYYNSKASLRKYPKWLTLNYPFNDPGEWNNIPNIDNPNKEISQKVWEKFRRDWENHRNLCRLNKYMRNQQAYMMDTAYKNNIINKF